MEVPLITAGAQDAFPACVHVRVAALRRRRRLQRLQSWGGRLAMLSGCVWVVLILVVGMGH